MGGEKLGRMAVAISVIGSPPHGRGKVLCSVFGVLPHRITPAWAGKSSSTRTRLPIRWDHPRMGGEKPPHWWRSSITEDHPRMGGEKPLSNVVCSTFSGSPPHGRGKVFKECEDEDFHRITPAWAGKRLKRSHRSGIFISGPIPFHSVLHRPAGSGGSRAGRDGSPAGQPQNAGPA